MSNPFAKADESSTNVETPAVTSESTEWDADSAPELDADSDPGFGEFEPEDKPSKADQKTVPYSRLAKVISDRNTLREEKSAVEQALAKARGEAEALKGLTAVVAEKYQSNPALLAHDANFMETWEVLARSNPEVAKVAALVQETMKKSGVQTVTDTTQTPAADAAQTPASNPVVDKLAEKTVTDSIVKALEAKGVKAHYAKMVARDVTANVDLADLVDVNEAQAVEFAKIYFKENDVPQADYLAPKQGAKPKPNTSGNARPAQTVTPGGEEGEGGEARPTFKTRDEFDAARSKRFAALAKEVLA